MRINQQEFAPWLLTVLEQLTQQAQYKNNPIILAGHDDKGLLQVAIQFLANSLCEQSNLSPACGHCEACHLFKSNNHPDVYYLWPQKELHEYELHGVPKGIKKYSESILIDEVRQCQDFFYTASSRLQKRYVLIYPFDALNTSSANALLKTLEEPPDHLCILLIGQALDHLPATVISRCQIVSAAIPSFLEQITWLRQQGAAEPEQLLSLALLNAYDALQLQHSSALLNLRRKWVQWLISEDPDDRLLASVDELGISVLYQLAMRVCYDFQLLIEGMLPTQFLSWIDDMQWVKRLPRDRVNTLFSVLQQENRFAHHPLNVKLSLDFITENWHLIKQ